MTMQTRIPKKIYYVWDGDIPARVAECIASWARVMPDYDIIEVNNSSPYFDLPGELERCAWFRVVFERKMWAYVADYIRVKTLFDHGGVYFDTDITALKRFDVFLHHGFFAAFESYDLVNVSVFGCEPRHPLLGDIYEFYQHDIWHSPLFTIPQITTHFLENKYACILYDSRVYDVPTRFGSIALYPEKYFYPYRYDESYSDDCITEDTYTIHWWGASWVKPAILDWLATKHLPSALDEFTLGGDIHEVQQHTARKLHMECLLFRRWRIFTVYRQANTLSLEIMGLFPLLTVLYEKQSAMYYLFNRFHLYTRKY